ncbi:Aste57867_14951 [Aphanomyces stellatus]|uniref:Aste57867_14951 protein n=1 Tax=Aphanomyces stellatus TaxID=120398 RepID=A0A485L4N2_9STRA|nr:hypothetical protein As57867_014895 [Aphanomyces stellatus]VFT91765.1 Aste57867_14951 [Aphanomyces stellatus]
MAMLETTVMDCQDTLSSDCNRQIRAEYTDGLYFLTLYADLDTTMTAFVYTNSDGTTQKLVSNPKRTLITGDGHTVPDDSGRDYIITSRPLGSRYAVTGYCITVIEELSELSESLGLTGWSQGKTSKLPIVPGWNCGSQVSNANELIALQIVFSLLSLVFFAGDMFITIEGLQGIIKGTPVLKYTILSGLERRKLLLLCLTIASMPGLLYMDVARIYYFTTNGFKIWTLSAILVVACFTFGFLLALSFVDSMLPFLRPHGLCLGYSAPFFIISSLVWLSAQWCTKAACLNGYNAFYSAHAFLGFSVNNATWPSGSYVAAGTSPIITTLSSSVVNTLGICFAASLGVSTLYRRVIHHRWLVDTSWCHSNSLLHHIHAPNFITALPLEPSNGIRIGNKLYCKPSTIALMGYAAVVAKSAIRASPSVRKQSNPSNVQVAIVSIYALLPALLRPQWVHILGRVDTNTFVPAPAPLGSNPQTHTRGPCVV